MSQMLELHRLVRTWAESSLAVRLPKVMSDEGATLAYIDLYFAFGLAELGESEPARQLVESSRRVLEGFKPGEDRALTAGLLLRAFRYRVEQALAGQPHAGSLTPDLLGEWESWYVRDKFTVSPKGVAHYVVGRMREQSRVLEPDERFDCYAEYMKHYDEVTQATFVLTTINDPDAFAQMFREFYQSGCAKVTDPDHRSRLLRQALPLANRTGRAFAAELLGLVSEVLTTDGQVSRYAPEITGRQGDLLERAFSIAAHFDLKDSASGLARRLAELVAAKPVPDRYYLAGRAVGSCCLGLWSMGLDDDLGSLVDRLARSLIGDVRLAELRERSLDEAKAGPETWATILKALVPLAGGWLLLGQPERADPILDEARDSLVGSDTPPFPARDYTALAHAYVAALGSGTAEISFPRVVALFRDMDPRQVTNCFTTSKFFSRLHLNLAEEAVFAACRLLGGPDVRPVVV